MTRLARRNRTRRIKAWKRAGNVYRNGKFWQRFTFRTITVPLMLGEWAGNMPIIFEEARDDAT